MRSSSAANGQSSTATSPAGTDSPTSKTAGGSAITTDAPNSQGTSSGTNSISLLSLTTTPSSSGSGFPTPVPISGSGSSSVNGSASSSGSGSGTSNSAGASSGAAVGRSSEWARYWAVLVPMVFTIGGVTSGACYVLF